MIPTDSLIARDAQQLQLLPSSAMDAALFQESESHGEYTAEILFERHRTKYLAAVSFLAEGIGILRCATLLQVSPNTIIAVREREGSAVDIERARLARLSRAAARLCVEAIVDLLSDSSRLREVSARDLGILHGILIDKSELLSGGATSRIEHVEAPGHADLLEYLSALGRRPAMGLEGGSGPQQRVIDVSGDVVVGPVAGVPVAAGAPGEGDQGAPSSPGAGVQGAPAADRVSAPPPADNRGSTVVSACGSTGGSPALSGSPPPLFDDPSQVVVDEDVTDVSQCP